jgi:hypothetical protein
MITACAAFSYKYYGVEYAELSKDVKLLGPKEENDKPFVLCETRGMCIVMFESEFFKMRRDYEEKSIRLIELERRCGRP